MTRETDVTADHKENFLFKFLFIIEYYVRQGSKIKEIKCVSILKDIYIYCNMNAFVSFDLFMVYIQECKQHLRTLK